MDLDIQNYSLEDILHLFKIPSAFTENDLKRAKKIVLKTHPDKSKLPPDYFRFYSKAYKVLFEIWEFRKKAIVDPKESNTDYSSGDLIPEEKKLLLDKLFKEEKQFKNSKDFNKWFNEQFNQHKIESETSNKGYQEWLKSDEGIDTTPQGKVSMATLAQEFEKKKKEARSLVVHKEVEETGLFSSSNFSSLDTQAPGHFDSGLFSSLQYQDLYKAHTETVIPITEEDYYSKEKFNTVNEYMTFRNGQNMKPLSEQQANQYLNQRAKKEEELATNRAYQLAKQTEIAHQKNELFWAKLQKIEK
jgi:hypothetical protein